MLDYYEFDHLISTFLEEDIGKGDITSLAIIPEEAEASFVMAARHPLVICGIDAAIRIFSKVDAEIALTTDYKDGAHIEGGAILMRGKGRARSVLAAERTALNLLQHLCGVATLTSQYVEAVRGTKCTILDTRKTIPGLRHLQKYAVRMGGGQNHRMGLDSGVLIKDNHISVCGTIEEAVRKARAGTPELTKIEVECDTLAQVTEAVAARADIILLDNMNNDELRQAVALVAGRVPLEASGNVSLATVRAIAETGVDYISIGKLTHSAPACDIGLDVEINDKFTTLRNIP